MAVSFFWSAGVGISRRRLAGCGLQSDPRYQSMRVYTMTTGVVFGLLVIAHLWRVYEEGSRVANPWFIGITVVAAAISLWAFNLARKAG